jgi:hypothetical protein
LFLLLQDLQKHTQTFAGEGQFPNAFTQMIVRDATANSRADGKDLGLVLGVQGEEPFSRN